MKRYGVPGSLLAQGGWVESKRATLEGGPSVCKALAMTYFLTGNPQYHRRDVVSRSVRDGKGWGQRAMVARNSVSWMRLAGIHALVREHEGWVVLPRRLRAHRLNAEL